jgi:putative ABC transport system ATP-binding protein
MTHGIPMALNSTRINAVSQTLDASPVHDHGAKPCAIQVSGLSQIVKTESGLLTVLEDITFSITQGEQVAITGRSGSGKSTLLGLLAGLDTPSAGQVAVQGQDLAVLNEDQRARLRLAQIGFVFQSFQLLSHLTALENVALPLTLAKKITAPVARKLASAMLARVGLGAKQLQYPRVLSGGEQQRVAIARALVHEPALIFADEPTGNLDDQTAAEIEDMLFTLNREQGATLVVVTHDLTLSSRCSRQLHLQAGRLVGDERTSSQAAGQQP